MVMVNLSVEEVEALKLALPGAIDDEKLGPDEGHADELNKVLTKVVNANVEARER